MSRGRINWPTVRTCGSGVNHEKYISVLRMYQTAVTIFLSTNSAVAEGKCVCSAKPILQEDGKYSIDRLIKHLIKL